MDFTFEDVLDEIKRLDSKQPEGFTMNEFSVAVNKSPHWCRIKSKELIDQGVIEFCGRKKIQAIDGIKRFSPVYRFIKK